GSYRLVWRVVSADGHPVEGSIVFWIGDSAAQPPPVAPAALNVPSTWGPTVIGAPVVPATLRGLGLGSLMALAGLLFCLSWPRDARDPAQRRPARLATRLSIAAAILLVLHLCAWIMNATPDHSSGVIPRRRFWQAASARSSSGALDWRCLLYGRSRSRDVSGLHCCSRLLLSS